MTRQIRFNAFDMNDVGHRSPGLWAHARDRSWQYKALDYWKELAQTLERGVFDGIFIASRAGHPACAAMPPRALDHADRHAPRHEIFWGGAASCCEASNWSLSCRFR